ncbi:hypothetical protein HMPREF1544_02907 [Mucor circinelloides 1006PhL]|uniref:O-fucosyltransferase family protein n=1 Tax=Mucor circinelloides f. circinelloides (strain 1006PhL) TaxID=1220926 RepID=S2JNV2_MUCC1|nr:hypothetical protein HMPREF1544_02907 [Mucor circinelloides 1006PhL]
MKTVHTITTALLCLACLSIWAICRSNILTSIQSQAKLQHVTQDSPKYMTYLPHSGLHNQRISLINAMIIAHALNRTLLMPELNIGSATFWADSNELAKQLELCPTYIKQNKKEASRRLRCHVYRKYKPLPVDSIFDLSSAHALDIHTEQRSDMSRDYIHRHASAHQLNETVYSVQDPFRYSYQIHDHDPDLYEFDHQDMNDKYLEHITLNELRARPETYLEFGSLFGTSRLQLYEPEMIWLREYLHRTTGLNHPEIKHSSQKIIQALGSRYTSVHLRQGDGIFQKMATETIAQVESALSSNLTMGHNNSNYINEQVMRRLKSTKSVQERLKQCQSAQHLQDPQVEMIYLATDASNPQQEFPQMFNRYPCLFTLSDFYNAKVLLQRKRHDKMDSLLPPMIDAEIASHANLFIGTPKSTYSAYVRYRNQHYRVLDFFSQ